MSTTSLAFDIFARDRASDTFNKVGRSADGVGARFKKMGKAVALVGAVAVVAAGRALFQMGKAAAEDAKSQALLANALRNSAGATKGQIAQTESWISAQGKALGVADDKLRPALSNLVRATGDVGKSQKLAALAMDVSAGSGKDLTAISAALGKAAQGNVAGLKKFQIETKNADGSTKSFAQVQDELSKKFGGAAKANAETFSGKMQRLSVLFDETKESIGAKLLPVVEKLATWFIGTGLPALQKFGGYLKEKLGPAFAVIKNVVANVMSGLKGDIGGNLSSIRSTFQSFASIVESLWKRFGGAITTYAVNTFKNLRTITRGALKIISGVFKIFSSLLKGDWKGVWDGIKKVLSGAWTVIKGLVRQGLNVLKTAFRIGWAAIKGIVSGVWGGIKGLVSNGITAVVDGIKSIPSKVKALGSTFKSAGKFIIDALVNGLKNAAGVIGGIAGNVWNAVKRLLNGAIGKINSALEFKISLPGPDLNVNLPDIPQLAKGGIVSRPTLALIGEAGPEAVVPLGAGRNRGGFGGGDVHITINGALDPVATGKQVQKILLQLKRTNGGQALGLA